MNDPKTILKKKYVDEHFSAGENGVEFTGNTWYKVATVREVNKVIEKSIQDNNDYASIFLVDARFEEKFHFCNLPRWVQSNKQEFKSIDELLSGLLKF